MFVSQNQASRIPAILSDLSDRKDLPQRHQTGTALMPAFLCCAKTPLSPLEMCHY